MMIKVFYVPAFEGSKYGAFIIFNTHKGQSTPRLQSSTKCHLYQHRLTSTIYIYFRPFIKTKRVNKGTKCLNILLKKR